jgi:DNA replication protein DnaC
MMEGTTAYRRKLTEEDLIRMRIPKRYWTAQPDQISDQPGKVGGISARTATKNYMDQIVEKRRTGQGLILYGTNGTGKSCMAICIGKEYRRRGHPVLFVEAADLKRLVIEREMFDEEQTFWDRALNVDVLLLDDVGKGTQDSTGLGARLLDELIRHRNANMLVTILTTNMNMEQLGEELKLSSMASLKEHAMPVHVCGIDRRDAVASEMAAAFSAQ